LMPREPLDAGAAASLDQNPKNKVTAKAVLADSCALFQSVWPPAVLIVGLIATVAWASFVTYWLVILLARVL
jgi:hypothetical protein